MRPRWSRGIEPLGLRPLTAASRRTVSSSSAGLAPQLTAPVCLAFHPTKAPFFFFVSLPFVWVQLFEVCPVEVKHGPLLSPHRPSQKVEVQ